MIKVKLTWVVEVDGPPEPDVDSDAHEQWLLDVEYAAIKLIAESPGEGEREFIVVSAGDEIKARLESHRAAIRAENISMGEIADLQSLADYIEPGDVELAEWAGIDEQEFAKRGLPEVRYTAEARGADWGYTEGARP